METVWRETKSDGLVQFSGVEPSALEKVKEEMKDSSVSQGLDLTADKVSQKFKNDSEKISLGQMVYHSELKEMGKVQGLEEEKVEVRINEESKWFEQKDLKTHINVNF